MKVPEIISRCKQRGVTLQLEGGKLFAEPAENLTESLKKELKNHKPEIVAHIQELQPALGARLSAVPDPPLDRAAKEKEAVRWLHAQAKEMKVSTNDPAYEFMVDVLRERREVVWEYEKDEDFMKALRAWAAAGRRALRVGIESEDEVMRGRDEIISGRQVFDMAHNLRREEAQDEL